MAGNCDATNGAGRSNAPMPGSVSSAACWFATNICLPFTVPFSISPVSGSPYENVFETRSRKLRLMRNNSPCPCAGKIERNPRRYRHIYFATLFLGVEVGVCRLAVMN